MSFWKRIGTALRSLVERVTGETVGTPDPGRDEVSEPRGGGRDGGIHGGDRESRLPDGWVLVGLYHQGEKTERVYATDDSDVTDGDIEGADALVVWYEDAGADGYRWVHGATGWDNLSDQVERTIVIVSPAGRGE